VLNFDRSEEAVHEKDIRICMNNTKDAAVPRENAAHNIRCEEEPLELGGERGVFFHSLASARIRRGIEASILTIMHRAVTGTISLPRDILLKL
jgi:hypothetical protein